MHCIVSNEPEQENTGTAFILDGMAIVQMMKAGGAQGFEKLAEKYYQYITSPFQQPGCNRVDVVFYRYDKPYSIKGNERECRGASLAPEIKIIGPALQSQNSGINTSVIHKIKAISLHSCHILRAKISQQELHQRQALVMGGGFKKYNKAVLVV